MLINKKIISLLILILFGLNVKSQDLTTFILVRHAEKAFDGTKDPALTEVGKDRSLRLASLLQKQEVAALYSTPFKRTQVTLIPIAQGQQLSIES